MAAKNAGTAPLEILGMHEPATIEQMRNCMGFGNVVAGVLAADGLGYAQPVGGVIAYQGQISISGVGFDVAWATRLRASICASMPSRIMSATSPKRSGAQFHSASVERTPSASMTNCSMTMRRGMRQVWPTKKTRRGLNSAPLGPAITMSI
jgi:hypothetical protein